MSEPQNVHQHNKERSAVITLAMDKGNLLLDTDYQGVVKRDTVKCYYKHFEELIGNFIYYWILSKIKPLLLQLPNLQITVNTLPLAQQQLGTIPNVITKIIEKTAEKLSAITPEALSTPASTEKRLLVLNVDDSYRINELYKQLRQTYGTQIYYMSMRSGFNPKNRTWEHNVDPDFATNLIVYCVKYRITQLLTTNHYFFTRALGQGVYLPAIFKQLKIKQYTYEIDQSDSLPHGYLTREAADWEGAVRFSFSHLQTAWEKTGYLGKTAQCVIPNNYHHSAGMEPKQEDFDLLVVSNSRVMDVAVELDKVMFIVDRLDYDNLLVEYQLWYLAVRRYLIRSHQFDTFEKLFCNTFAHNLSYTVGQFVKYEIIHQALQVRNLKIFGDDGWAHIFPDHFTGRYLNSEEYEAEVSSPANLLLLLNWNISLYSSGVISDIVAKNAYHLAYRPLLVSEGDEGFVRMSYRNFAELQAKLRQGASLFTQREKASMDQVRHKFAENITDLVRLVGSGGGSVEGGSGSDMVHSTDALSTIGHLYHQDHQKLEPLIDQFSEKYRSLIEESIQLFTLSKLQNYPFQRSSLSTRPYFSSLLRLYHENLANLNQAELARQS